MQKSYSSTRRWSRCALLLIMMPLTAWADLSGTVTVPAASAVSLDTGVVSGSGGDILFNGTTLAAQGKAKTFDTGGGQLVAFNGFTLATLQQLASVASNTPITAVTGHVIVVLTNGGNYAKVLVTTVSSSSITLQYLTYGATAAPAGPSISAVQNNYSYLQPGLPNYGIAPGSLFIVKGAGLSNPGTAVLQSSGGSGIPTTLNGASISVTVNGVTTHPGMYYAIPSQIAAVLPSSTPAGAGTITVTYNGVASSPAPILVVSTALGFDSYFGSGVGLGVATDTSGNLFTYSNSAKPGQAIVLWASGLGADMADSDTVFTSAPHAVNVPLQIYVGGVQASILYQGASGYPGVNQIDITIPSSVLPGCAVSIVGVSGSIVSNTVTLPVTAGGGPCSDPVLGLTNSASSVNGKFGTLQILQATTSAQTISTAAASFSQISGLATANVGTAASLGSCYFAQVVPGATSTVISTGLDAGTISVKGPSATQTLTTIPTLAGFYSAQLPAGFIPAAGGSFVFTGTGGKDVGAFTGMLTYANPLVWTNMASITAINRSQGVSVTWSGGAPNSYVEITGSATSPASGVNGGMSAGFTCYAPVSAGQFTVPSYVTLGVPAGAGSLSVENGITPVIFSAPGLDYFSGIAAIYSSISPAYQ